MLKKILISGANGFIGKHLCQYFVKEGFDVYGLVRSIPTKKVEGVHYQKFDLENIDQSIIKEGFSAFIHGAYIPFDKHTDSESINIQASHTLSELCKAKGIHFIFISSLSALPKAKSKYGSSKYKIEQLIDTSISTIVRPGLVIGDGGLYKNMENFIQKSSIVPLFGGGNQVIQQIEIEKLCALINTLVAKKIVGEYSFAEERNITMKEWYLNIAKGLNKKIKFINIPYFIADILFFILDIIPLKLSVGKENYLGLKQMEERTLDKLD